jgi:hypothetical protein
MLLWISAVKLGSTKYIPLDTVLKHFFWHQKHDGSLFLIFCHTSNSSLSIDVMYLYNLFQNIVCAFLKYACWKRFFFYHTLYSQDWSVSEDIQLLSLLSVKITSQHLIFKSKYSSSSLKVQLFVMFVSALK